jgi:hypothetical protein
MNLTEFFKGKSVYSWARENGFPGPRLAEHILYEKSQGGRPLGPQLAVKMAIASEGQIRLSDLLPELAEKIKVALAFELKSHG